MRAARSRTAAPHRNGPAAAGRTATSGSRSCSAPLLSVERLEAGYGDAVVVRGVDLAVDPGTMMCLIGPNGSGKSTLLKAMVGLADVQAGSVRLRGDEIAGRRTDGILALGVGFVPQTNHVFGALSVEDNLKLGMRRDTQPTRLEAMYELFPMLREKRRQRGNQLSGGQRQMVACARALIAEPAVLLLDEPSAGLSPAATHDLFQRLTAIRDGGVGVLVVEQNALAALEVADRCLVLADGEARFEGTAAAVLAHPDIGRLYLGGG